MREETRQDLMAAQELGAKYDALAKAIWRNKEILAPLLKYAVRELKDQSVEDIIKLIDADSIRDNIPVSDLPPTVIDRGTHQTSPTEKEITYDLRFFLKNPLLSVGNILVMLHFDLEFQNKYRPVLKDGKSYPVVTRGIYYGAREISSQLGRITQETNYANLEKIISIWIVNEEIPQELQGTATRYYIKKEDFIGHTNEPEYEYDLMEVIIIRRGDRADLTQPIYDYLKGIYEANLSKIDEYTPASNNPEIVKEVKEMPGMSEVILEKGRAEGRIEGRAEGRAAGEEELIINMLKRNKTPEAISEFCGIPVDKILAVREKMILSSI